MSGPTWLVNPDANAPVRGHTASATIQRANNTTAYSAGTVINGAIQFAGMGVSGGDIVITSVELEIDASALISGETSYNLYLYNVTPPSALADGASFSLASGDRASFVGKINMGTPIVEGATLYIRTDSVNAHVKLSGTDLFGYLVTVGGYTPTALRVYKPTLHSTDL